MKKEKNIRLNTLSIFLWIIISLSCSTSKKIPQEPIKFLDVYYTNESGERITNYRRNTEFVYLVVVTGNGKGREIGVQFTEEEPEIIYKNKYYGNGDFFETRLKKNTQTFKLRIYHAHNKKHQEIKEKTLKNKENKK